MQEENKQELMEYEEFVQSHPKGHFAQSLKWAELKKEWKSEIVTVKDENGKIKGSMLLLIRKIPIFKNTIIYSPRGPVCDIHDEETLTELIKKAEEVVKKNKGFILQMDPDIPNNDMEFKNIVKKNGFKVIEKLKNLNKVLQPRIVFRLDLRNKTEDEIFSAFHSKTRYNIRLATKKGVTIRVGNREDIGEFEKLMEITGKRDGFPIRTKEYFEEIYDVLGKDNVRFIFAEYEGKPIAAVLDFFYGDKVWYMYGASSNEHRNLMSTYLLQWEGIKWALENHCSYYDFRGICAIDENTRNEGLYRFKKGFNPDLIEFTEIYKVYNPFIFFLYDKVFDLYRKLRIKFMKKNVEKENEI